MNSSNIVKGESAAILDSALDASEGLQTSSLRN